MLTPLILILTLTLTLQSASKYKYKTSFGICPTRSAGNFVLDLIDIFEEKSSLREVKDKIVTEGLREKYFISTYEIKFDPFRKTLHFELDCPFPLMRVQIYKDGSFDSQYAILVDNGDLYDLNYETLLRKEKKLDQKLPSLALPQGPFDKKLQKKMIQMMNTMGMSARDKISEIIVDKTHDLTIILSVHDHPSSVFIGRGKWMEKVNKLRKIIHFLGFEDHFPSIINLTNSEKVVVKFKQ